MGKVDSLESKLGLMNYVGQETPQETAEEAAGPP